MALEIVMSPFMLAIANGIIYVAVPDPACERFISWTPKQAKVVCI
jgi:hypothetical protein